MKSNEKMVARSSEVIIITLLFSSLGILTSIESFTTISLVIPTISVVSAIISRNWIVVLKILLIVFAVISVYFLEKLRSNSILNLYAIAELIVAAVVLYSTRRKIQFNRHKVSRHIALISLILTTISTGVFFLFITITIYAKLLDSAEVSFNPDAFFLILLPAFLLGILLFLNGLLYLPFKLLNNLMKVLDPFFTKITKHGMDTRSRIHKEQTQAKILLIIGIFLNVFTYFLVKDEYYRFTHEEIEINPIWTLGETKFQWNEVTHGEISVSSNTNNSGQIKEVFPTIKVTINDKVFSFTYDPFPGFDGADEYLEFIALMHENDVTLTYAPVAPEVLSLVEDSSMKSDLIRRMYSTQTQ